MKGGAVLTASVLLLAAVRMEAQVGRGAQTPKAAAPVDLTGYWVSVVTEDWRFRMMTPAKGDYPSIPLNADARKVADAWDPAKDEAAGDACKAYGAGNIMRLPGRLHVTWQDDNTLRIETDTGMQTRLLHFGRPQTPTAAPDWQGFSVAQWEFAGGRRGGPAQGGELKVVTTRMRPGYLQKNGVPYSADAVITEHFDLLNKEANGDQWLIVTTLVEDPQYLNQPFQRSTHFKRQFDASGWDPSPCAAR
jgi:hypothetical protein